MTIHKKMLPDLLFTSTISVERNISRGESKETVALFVLVVRKVEKIVYYCIRCLENKCNFKIAIQHP